MTDSDSNREDVLIYRKRLKKFSEELNNLLEIEKLKNEIDVLVTRLTDRLKRNFPPRTIHPIKTRFYEGDTYSKSVPLMTLGEFIQTYGLDAGQQIHLAKLKDGDYYETTSFWVGDVTPHRELSPNAVGLGWRYNSEICQQYIVRIYEYGTN